MRAGLIRADPRCLSPGYRPKIYSARLEYPRNADRAAAVSLTASAKRSLSGGRKRPVGTTSETAAMTFPSWSRTGAATAQVPGLRSSLSYAIPSRRTRSSSCSRLLRLSDRRRSETSSRHGQQFGPFLLGLEGREYLAVGVGRVSDDPSHRHLSLERPGGIDHVDAHCHAVDLHRQGRRFPRLGRQFLEVRPSDLDQVLIRLGEIRGGQQRGTEVIAARDRIPDQIAGRFHGADHAVGRHARKAGPLGYLVEGPLPVLSVEEPQYSQTLGQSPHQKGAASRISVLIQFC